MYISVDEQEHSGTVEGFQYTNKNGDTEKVRIYNSVIVEIHVDDSDQQVAIYTVDIPKLIKALEAAKNHIESTY